MGWSRRRSRALWAQASAGISARMSACVGALAEENIWRQRTVGHKGWVRARHSLGPRRIEVVGSCLDAREGGLLTLPRAALIKNTIGCRKYPPFPKPSLTHDVPASIDHNAALYGRGRANSIGSQNSARRQGYLSRVLDSRRSTPVTSR